MKLKDLTFDTSVGVYCAQVYRETQQNSSQRAAHPSYHPLDLFISQWKTVAGISGSESQWVLHNPTTHPVCAAGLEPILKTLISTAQVCLITGFSDRTQVVVPNFGLPSACTRMTSFADIGAAKLI